DGTGSDDQIYITQDQLNFGRLKVRMNGAAVLSLPLGVLERLTINGAGGFDTTYLDSNGPTAGGDVDFLRFEVAVNGGDHGLPQARLQIVDLDDGTADQVTVTSTKVGAETGDTFFGTCGRVTYNSLANLDLLMGNGKNSITVRATQDGTDTLIALGAAADTITVDHNGTGPGG